MSLEKRFEELPDGIESDDIKELRSVNVALTEATKTIQRTHMKI
jgi:hypothetical protein